MQKLKEPKKFNGKLLYKNIVIDKVIALYKSGVTSESKIVKSIYPGKYSITNSKPRLQIHAIRVKYNLICFPKSKDVQNKSDHPLSGGIAISLPKGEFLHCQVKAIVGNRAKLKIVGGLFHDNTIFRDLDNLF